MGAGESGRVVLGSGRSSARPRERARSVVRLRLVLGAVWASVTVALAIGALVPPHPDASVQVHLDGAALVLVPFLLAWLTTFGLLVSGPEPYRATRWAWFWLSAPPVGLLAFVVLSGPTPGLGITRSSRPRLTGTRAFLVGLLLTAVVPPPWWW